MGVDQAARSPARSAASLCSDQKGSLAMSATSTWRSRYTAAAHEPLRMSTRACSRALRRVSGNCGATMWSNDCRCSASTLTEETVPTPADSMKRVMEASTSGNGALRVICSNTLRSASTTRSLRLRSEMSAMLPRTSRRLPLGRRTSRTSHMISPPAPS